MFSAQISRVKLTVTEIDTLDFSGRCFLSTGFICEKRWLYAIGSGYDGTRRVRWSGWIAGGLGDVSTKDEVCYRSKYLLGYLYR